MPDSNSCALHIRLFDGTSIREAFSADTTLTKSVRSTVQHHSHTDQPYNFRLIARPPRTIEISEEGLSLRELGLCPNATLVLVPVRDFTDAYASGGAAGLVQKSVGMGWNALTGMANVVTTLAGRAMGYGITGAHAQGFYIDGEQAGDHARVNTLANHMARDDSETYNGNQLNVEPRPKDEK